MLDLQATEDRTKKPVTGSFAVEPPVYQRQVVMYDTDVLVAEEAVVPASSAYRWPPFSVEVEVEEHHSFPTDGQGPPSSLSDFSHV